MAATLPEGSTVRFRGSPQNMPTIPSSGVGHIVFRSWNHVIVSISPNRPLTTDEGDAVFKALRSWNNGSGLTILSGASGDWPFEEN